MILILSTQSTSDGPLWDMAEQEASGLLVVAAEKHGDNHYPSLAILSLPSSSSSAQLHLPQGLV